MREVLIMKFLRKLTNAQFAESAASTMKSVCYLVICFYALTALLCFMGRQSFFLHSKTGTFEHAIYAEDYHNAHSNGMTVFTGDDIHVWTNDNDQIDLAIQIGLSLIYAVHIVPMILAYWFLSRVFSNISQGQIFTESNSSYLLYYGLLQFSAAVFVPFIKLLICKLINLVSNSRMTILTGLSTFNTLIPSIAFIVAAYIIHYGVRLQDEVDHTL